MVRQMIRQTVSHKMVSRKRNRIAQSFVLLAAFLFLTPAARADLFLGETLNVSYRFPTFGTNYAGNNSNVLVGPGTELHNWPWPALAFDVDIDDTSILLTFNRNGAFGNTAFNGLSFFDIFDSIPAITSVGIDSLSTWTAFTSNDISFTEDRIQLNFEGLGFQQGAKLKLNVNANAGLQETSHVPEPGALVLLGSGLLLFSGVMKRRYRGAC